MVDPDIAPPRESDASSPGAAPGPLPADFVASVRGALDAADLPRLRELVADLHETDLADLLESLAPQERPRFVELLGKDFDFAALTELDDTVRLELLEELPTETIVEGVRELDSDDAIYILEDLDEEDRAEILARLPSPERVALTRGLDFPEESAGRRMQSDFIAVPQFWTVGRTIDFLRETPDLPETFYEIYVVDPAYKLIGTVPLDRLLRTRRPVSIQEILDDDPRTVLATLDQEEVARLFERYNLVSAPVVDEHGRLVGMLTVDDVVDVIQEEAEEDLKALGGVFGDEELSDSVLYTARSRFPWLAANVVTAFLAASVIGLFDGTIEEMVALAVLMPIVASMGGNAGTQTMTVTVRALATQEIGGHNARRVLSREILVGLVNGALIALLVGTIAALWFRNPDLGVVIGSALVVNMLVAGLVGVIIPLTLARLGADPAVASSVFLTMVTDVVGFFAFLGLAALWFGASLA